MQNSSQNHSLKKKRSASSNSHRFPTDKLKLPDKTDKNLRTIHLREEGGSLAFTKPLFFFL